MDASSEIAMPVDSTADCAEGRGENGLETLASPALRGDKSLDFQKVPSKVSQSHRPRIRSGKSARTATRIPKIQNTPA